MVSRNSCVIVHPPSLLLTPVVNRQRDKVATYVHSEHHKSTLQLYENMFNNVQRIVVSLTTFNHWRRD